MDEPVVPTPDVKDESEFASFDGWLAYDPFTDPDAMWTWPDDGASRACNALYEPVG